MRWCRCCNKAPWAFGTEFPPFVHYQALPWLGAAASLRASSVCERLVWGCGTFMGRQRDTVPLTRCPCLLLLLLLQVIFLYLLDNETSMVVLASAGTRAGGHHRTVERSLYFPSFTRCLKPLPNCAAYAQRQLILCPAGRSHSCFCTAAVLLMNPSPGIGTAIEFWKVTKAMDVSVSTTFPFLSIKDRASYSNNPTKEYDRTAMRYLSYALYPLVIGYSIYALMYETHKSWYSWLLGSLVGAVYMFGFILMCPQVGFVGCVCMDGWSVVLRLVSLCCSLH